MPIKNHLSEVMGRQRVTQRELQKRTALSYTTLGDLYHERAQRIDLGTLEKLCRALGVGVADLLEYQPADRRHGLIGRARTKSRGLEDPSQG